MTPHEFFFTVFGHPGLLLEICCVAHASCTTFGTLLSGLLLRSCRFRAGEGMSCGKSCMQCNVIAVFALVKANYVSLCWCCVKLLKLESAFTTGELNGFGFLRDSGSCLEIALQFVVYA